MLTRKHQIKALAESKLVAVFLSAKWAESQRHVQAALVLYWWPRIEKQIEAAKPCDCWLVPFDFGDVQLEKIAIDLAKVAAAL